MLRRYPHNTRTLFAAVLALLLTASAALWSHQEPLESRVRLVTAAVATIPPTTTTTTQKPPERASRSAGTVRRATTARPGPTAGIITDPAHWRRLANCESADGRSGTYLGYFQFSRDTARKVGWFAGATYEQQVVMAQRWASMIHPREGTRSGWPICWWRALRG